MELREFVKQCPELGEVLAEFENRLAYLESILPYRAPEEPGKIKPVFKSRPVNKEIDQLKAGFLHLQKELNKHISIRKVTTLSKNYKNDRL